ncbi:unnamed protein product, partial [marine sediment metagenome]
TLRISKTMGIEGKKLLKPEDEYEALKNFNHDLDGTKTQTESLLLEFKKLLKANPNLENQLRSFPGEEDCVQEVCGLRNPVSIRTKSI